MVRMSRSRGTLVRVCLPPARRRCGHEGQGGILCPADGHFALEPDPAFNYQFVHLSPHLSPIPRFAQVHKAENAGIVGEEFEMIITRNLRQFRVKDLRMSRPNFQQ